MLGTLVLSYVIVKHLLRHFVSKLALRNITEVYFFIGLTVLWSVEAIVSAVASPASGSSRTGKAVVAFSWINVIAHSLSGGIAFIEHRVEDRE